MKGPARWSRWLLALALAVPCSLAAQVPGRAWAEDSWSFVITPQVWMSHIAKNGFAAAPVDNVVGGFVLANANGDIVNPILSSSSNPVEAISPQWGIQAAAQKGRLTLAGAFQYVTFETRNTLTWSGPFTFDPSTGASISPGQLWAKEYIYTTRMDVDFSASYFFPDVVRNRLDGSLGAGFKFIYATASRQFRDENPLAAEVNSISPGLYTICGKLDCSDAIGSLRVNEDSQIYGVTFPTNLTLHLTNDGKWLLPFNISPMLGAEHRNDHNVVYSVDLPPNLDGLPAGTHVNRLDGWKFAYGFTSDLLVRWLITDSISAYAGIRVQYIKSFDKYLAYGPLVGVSVRFGGK